VGRVIAAVPLLLATAALGACGEDQAESAGEVNGVGKPIGGSVAALAQCGDWNEGTVGERRATVEDIQAQLNQAGSDGPTPDLPDDEAYDVLERACAKDFAEGFRLYKIYARAAAFSPLTESSSP
jgi:hypothetical protein